MVRCRDNRLLKGRGDLRRAAQAQHNQFSELEFYKLAAKKVLDKLKPSGKAE
jgi:hypothetical protein